MGNVKRTNKSSNRIVGFSAILLAIASSFISANAFAAGCSSEVLKDADGAYSGCSVKMGNREYTVGKDGSSENGCSHVCSIMAEVNGSRAGRGQKISAAKIEN